MTRSKVCGGVAAVGDTDKTRDGKLGPSHFTGDNGTQCWVLDTALSFPVSGMEHILGARVSAFQGAHATQQGNSVHLLGQFGQVLADSHTCRGCANGFEFASAFTIWLQVECVLMAWATIHPQYYAGFGLGCQACLGVGEHWQPTRQRGCCNSRCRKLHGIAAVQARGHGMGNNVRHCVISSVFRDGVSVVGGEFARVDEGPQDIGGSLPGIGSLLAVIACHG